MTMIAYPSIDKDMKYDNFGFSLMNSWVPILISVVPFRD